MRCSFRRLIGRCAAPFAAVLAGAIPLAAMEFGTVPMGKTCSRTECARAVIAEGEITPESPARFARFLAGELQVPGLHAVVFLNSPGGSVESALKLGNLLHDVGAAAVIGRPAVAGPGQTRRKLARLSVVPGQCASACVYTLMGAKKRVVPQGARLGVHRMSARTFFRDPALGSTEQSRIFAGAEEIALLRAYAARVGGSQELISLAESVPHDRIRYLSGGEVKRFRLGNPNF